MLQISANIAQARESRGLTQAEVAQKLGMSRSTYANWEKTTEPSFSDIKRIAEILDTPVTVLIGEDLLITDFEKRLLSYVMKINADTIALKGVVAEIVAHQHNALVSQVIDRIDKSVLVALQNMKQESKV